ncbi:hypothetical protein AA313_de0208739 [Arthrobotrys entomopaga]|nr:hypothetical protein AA313_de0208739 [Arthrobotrys entomopaga]
MPCAGPLITSHLAKTRCSGTNEVYPLKYYAAKVAPNGERSIVLRPEITTEEILWLYKQKTCTIKRAHFVIFYPPECPPQALFSQRDSWRRVVREQARSSP